MYATSIIMLLGTPVIAITILLLAIERLFHVGIFDPRLGGDPILFQHLFWFYSHPAVYIMILPAMGVISEIIPCFAKKRIFGYKFVAFSSLAIAILGFFVWGHHMFVSGQSAYAGLVFSILFSWYVASFGSYNKTYGSLGAVIGFMTWIWLSTAIVLLGAELNAEMEHQTAKDTTEGPDEPIGQRGATMADTVGAAKA